MVPLSKATARCPVSSRALKAFGMYARGLSYREISDGLDVQNVNDLMFNGRRALGVASNAAAVRALVDGGWLARGIIEGGPSAVERYLLAWDEYRQAPPHERDQMLVRDLCNAALDELLADAPSAPPRRSVT